MERLSFNEEEIQKLFGHEAAEDENLERLREYYFKSAVYDQVVANLPLRILVAHKGIGKSALFQVAMAEDKEELNLPVLIKPDDIIDLGMNESDFLKTIRNWKKGLLEIIGKKVLSSLGGDTKGIHKEITKYGGKLLDFLIETFKKSYQTINIDPTKKLIVDHFLSSRRINIYIDDLDRGWEGSRDDVKRLSALLNAIRDIANENKGICFRVGLRSDVYYLVRTSDESTDKIEGSVVWHSWTNHEIFVLLVKRIETFFGREIDEERLLKMPQRDMARYLDTVMEERFRGEGHWLNCPMYRVLMSLIRKRPRDLVKLCTLAAKKSCENKNNIIRTEDFKDIFEQYSQGRVQDTINEFRSELPDIERLVINMKPNKRERTANLGYVYKTDGLLKKILDISEQGQFKFANKKIASPKDLAAFMYKVNFLTARKETPTGITRKFFEENRYLSSDFADFGFDWEIHPAYRWALQPDDPRNIFQSLELTSDDL
jgi:hypothetical protein